MWAGWTRSRRSCFMHRPPAAVADAGLRREDIDGFASNGTGALNPIEVAEYIGLKPTWLDSTGVGGGTWEIMAAHAADAIHGPRRRRGSLLRLHHQGRSEEQAPSRQPQLRGRGGRSVTRCLTATPSSASTPWRRAATCTNTARHSSNWPTSRCSTCYNAGFNPDAYYRDPISVDEVLESRMIVDPFTKLHCCIRSDGGCAVVLAAEDHIPDSTRAPVWVLGHGQHASHTTMSEWEDFTSGPAAVSGPIVFERPGSRPRTSTWLASTTRSPTWRWSPSRTSDSSTRVRAARSSPPGNPPRRRAAGEPRWRRTVRLPPRNARPVPDRGSDQAAPRRLRGGGRTGTSGGRRQLAAVSGTGGWFCANGTLILGAD